MADSTDTAAATEGSLTSAITYWFSIAGVYVLLGMTFFKSGWGKLFDDDGKAPKALADQFSSTFIDSFPGVDAAWVVLGILELVVVALLVLSLVAGEFLPGRPGKGWLKSALGVALLTFSFLALGQTTIGNHEGTASLYTYFGATGVILLLVDRLGARRG
jgi:hypothetical protein